MGVLTFTFDIPQTKSVSFDKLHIQVTEANESKKKLQQATKLREKMTNAISKNRSHAETIQCIEDYLPYLNGIVNAIDRTQSEAESCSIAFQWTSGLLEEQQTKGFIAKSKKAWFIKKNIRFELVMTLWTYGYTLCNAAADLIRTSTTNTFHVQSKDASVLLRKASGIFDFLASTELPRLAMYVEEKKLPELVPQAATTLLNYCLPLTQIIAIHGAIESGKSPKVIAKLCIKVYRLFDSSKEALDDVVKFLRNEGPKSTLSHSASVNNLNSQANGALSPCTLSEGLRIIVVQYRILYRGITLYYLALDANKNEQAGLSVGYIVTANLQLKELDIFKDVKNNPFMPEMRRIYMESKKLETKYEKENRMVFREPVPTAQELEIPDGVILFKPTEYAHHTAVYI